MSSAARSKKSPDVRKKSPDVRKKSPGVLEKSPEARKKSPGASKKSSGTPEKSAKGPKKSSGTPKKSPGAPAEASPVINERTYQRAVGQLDALAAAPLERPDRPPRQVSDLDAVAQESRARIVLAWVNRAVLQTGLPAPTEAFFATGWTALKEVEAAAGAAPLGTPAAAQPALVRLVEELGVVRAVVRRHTTAGSDARAAVLMSQRLLPSASLLPLAERILAGARTLQGRFVALDDATLQGVSDALDRARSAVLGRAEKRAEQSVLRTGRDEHAQLALDVLLHTTDHLATAALTRLRGSLPELHERLVAPLEKSAPQEPAEDEPPPEPVVDPKK